MNHLYHTHSGPVRAESHKPNNAFKCQPNHMSQDLFSRVCTVHVHHHSMANLGFVLSIVTYEIMIHCSCDFCSKVLTSENHLQYILPCGKYLMDHVLGKVSITFVSHLRCCYGFSVSPLVSRVRTLIPQIRRVRRQSFMGSVGVRGDWISALLQEPVSSLRARSLGKTGILLLRGAAPCVLFLPHAPVGPSALYHGVTQHEFLTGS